MNKNTELDKSELDYLIDTISDHFHGADLQFANEFLDPLIEKLKAQLSLISK